MMPLNHIPRKCTAGCKLSKLQEKNQSPNHQLQTVCQNKKEWETLLNTVRIYNQETGMEFVMENATCKK